MGLTLEDCTSGSLLDTLSSFNFNEFVTFIKSMDVMLRQLGTLLLDFLPSLVNVLVGGVVKLSKLFIKRVSSIKEEDVAVLEELGEEDPNEEKDGEGQVVHRNAGR